MTDYYVASNVNPITNVKPIITTDIAIKIYDDLEEAIKDAKVKLNQDGYCFVVIPAIIGSLENPTLYTTYKPFEIKLKQIQHSNKSGPKIIPPVSNLEIDGKE